MAHFPGAHLERTNCKLIKQLALKDGYSGVSSLLLDNTHLMALSNCMNVFSNESFPSHLSVGYPVDPLLDTDVEWSSKFHALNVFTGEI